MGSGFHKKNSKRTTLKRKYRIMKKVREHNRKKNKEARKNPNAIRKKKDPGIPKSLPFRDQIIKEIEEAKEKERERKIMIREEFRKREKQTHERAIMAARGFNNQPTEEGEESDNEDQEMSEEEE